MDTLLAIAVPIVLFVSVFVGLAATGFYRSVVGMCSPLARLDPADLPEGSPELESTAGTDEWANTHGFEWVGSYRTSVPNNPPIFAAAWRRADGTHLTHYRHPGGTAHDLVSIFDEAGWSHLTTTSAGGTMISPRPDDWWAQAFPGADLDELLRRHQDALAHVAASAGKRPVTPRAEFEDMVIAVIRAHARHTRAVFLWPIRGVAWFLLRKRRDGVPVDRGRRAA